MAMGQGSVLDGLGPDGENAPCSGNGPGDTYREYACFFPGAKDLLNCLALLGALLRDDHDAEVLPLPFAAVFFACLRYPAMAFMRHEINLQASFPHGADRFLLGLHLRPVGPFRG